MPTTFPYQFNEKPPIEKNPDEAKRLRQLIITTKEGGMREDGMIGDTEAMKARLNAALAKGTYPSGSSNMP